MSLPEVARNDELEIRIIDALREDLDNEADLPPHVTILYKRPAIVVPEMCPLLNIWLVGKRYTPRTTAHYDNSLALGISWQQASVVETLTLEQEEEDWKDLLHATGEIQRRLRYRSVHTTLTVRGEPIEEAYDFWPEQVDYLPPTSSRSTGTRGASATETGLVEGYALTVRVSVLERG